MAELENESELQPRDGANTSPTAKDSALPVAGRNEASNAATEGVIPDSYYNRAPLPGDYPWCERDEIVQRARAMKAKHRAQVAKGAKIDATEVAYLAWLVETDTVEPKIVCREDPLFFDEWTHRRLPQPRINSDDEIPF